MTDALKQSDTPLTDAAVNSGGNQLLNVAECSRAIERDNAALRAQLDNERNDRLAWSERAKVAEANVELYQSQLAEKEAELLFHEHRTQEAHNFRQQGMPQGKCTCHVCRSFYDQLNAALAKSFEARGYVGHIASILAGKRNSHDSTIHAGNTAFISMERWAERALKALPQPPEEKRAVFSGEVGSTFCKECRSPLIGTEIEAGLCGGCADFLNEPPEEK